MKKFLSLLCAALMAVNLFAGNAAEEENPIAVVSQNPGLCSIFHHWGFIGDSLCSGEFEYTTPEGKKGYWDCYEYAWGRRMCDLMGVKGDIYAKGGETARGWIQHFWDSNENRLRICAKDSPKQAYVIALGINDSNCNPNGSYRIGDVATDIDMQDYNNNAVSFAGCYAGIVQRLKQLQPEVKIFLVTMPKKTKKIRDFNDVIRQIAGMFDNVWVLDLEKYAADYYLSDEFKKNYMMYGHMSPAGYEYTAWEFMTYIDWIIRNDQSAFKEVGFMIHGAPARQPMKAD